MKIIKNITCFFILSAVMYFVFLTATDHISAATTLWDSQDTDIKSGISKPFSDPSARPHDVRDMVVNVINVFLGFLGIIFLVLIIWAGARWMTSRGNQDQVNAAKSQIIRAIVGFMIIASALIITNLVDNTVRKEMFDSPW